MNIRFVSTQRQGHEKPGKFTLHLTQQSDTHCSYRDEETEPERSQTDRRVRSSAPATHDRQRRGSQARAHIREEWHCVGQALGESSPSECQQVLLRLKDALLLGDELGNQNHKHSPRQKVRKATGDYKALTTPTRKKGTDDRTRPGYILRKGKMWFETKKGVSPRD